MSRIKFVLYTLLSLCMLLAPCANAQFMSNRTAEIGGSGYDGIVTKSGTETNWTIINARTFNVTGTWSPRSGTIVNARNDVNISGTLSVQADQPQAEMPNLIMGDPQGPGIVPGGGPGKGSDSCVYTIGPGGGGFGGVGGNGGWIPGVPNGGLGGLTYSPLVFPAGSRGGYGSSPLAPADDAGLPGGGGGGIKIIAGGSINVTTGGSITVNGENGTAGESDLVSAGAGGSGGFALLAARKSITVTPALGVQAKGGNGVSKTTNQSAASGGGGGGVIIFIAPSITVTSTDVSGGTGGSAGSWNPGAAGSPGQVLQIPTEPSAAVIGLFRDKQKVADFCRRFGPGTTIINKKMLDQILEDMKHAA